VLALYVRWLWQKAKDKVTVTTDFFPEVNAARRQNLDACVGVFALVLRSTNYGGMVVSLETVWAGGRQVASPFRFYRRAVHDRRKRSNSATGNSSGGFDDLA
jgi:hypothetical protein